MIEAENSILQNYVNLVLIDNEQKKQYDLLVSNEDARKASEDANFYDMLLTHVKLHCEAKELDSDNDIQIREIFENTKENTEDNTEKFSWGYNSTLCLITAVEQHYDELNHPKKRKHVWNNICNELLSQAIEATPDMCNRKWRNLLRTYISCKDINTKSGRAPPKFNFFDRMDSFLGTQPAISNVHSIDVCTTKRKRTEDEIAMENIVQDPETNEENNIDNKSLSSEENTTSEKTEKKKKNTNLEYIKARVNYLNFKTEEKKKRTANLLKYMETKLMLEARNVAALEELVKTKKQKLIKIKITNNKFKFSDNARSTGYQN